MNAEFCVKPILFDLGALYYDVVTAWLPEWKEDCARLAQHLREHDRLIVDLGCGPGVSSYETAASASQALVIGIDISHLMLRRALRNRRRYPSAGSRVHFIRGDALAMPFATASVDVVTSHSSFYLIPDKRAVLEEIRRVLRPAGQVILFEPRRERSLMAPLNKWLTRPRYAWIMSVWGIVSRVEGAFREGQLPSMLRESGFSVQLESLALEGFGWLVVASSPAH